MALTYGEGRWAYTLIRYAPEETGEMTFPDENYRYACRTRCFSARMTV